MPDVLEVRRLRHPPVEHHSGRKWVRLGGDSLIHGNPQLDLLLLLHVVQEVERVGWRKSVAKKTEQTYKLNVCFLREGHMEQILTARLPSAASCRTESGKESTLSPKTKQTRGRSQRPLCVKHSVSSAHAQQTLRHVHVYTCLLPEVMLVISQPHGQQHAGTELQEALMKLLGHKVEPAVHTTCTGFNKNQTSHCRLMVRTASINPGLTLDTRSLPGPGWRSRADSESRQVKTS